MSLDDEALGEKVVEDSQSRRVAKSKTLSGHFDSIDSKAERDVAIDGVNYGQFV